MNNDQFKKCKFSIICSCVCVFHLTTESWTSIINIWSAKKIVFALIKKTTCLISELNDVTVAISLSKRKVIIVFGMVPIWETVSAQPYSLETVQHYCALCYELYHFYVARMHVAFKILIHSLSNLIICLSYFCSGDRPFWGFWHQFQHGRRKSGSGPL